ncbi:hypothetical protein BV25DRAFT_1816927 [Artomyces pyxidatus]|uniref:Uncharacterized protein n=1 Tax=Artomyces pyxidatus TaxID=48021 RepID=A0ACB8SDN2_9AGAM|nr:hypothetical protein BV25DRAFT_1816927 [Artomyces pyxidatus]
MTQRSKCLQSNHKTAQITDLIRVAQRLDPPLPGEHPHRSRSNCACNPCTVDRHNTCENPHKCAVKQKHDSLSSLPS